LADEIRGCTGGEYVHPKTVPSCSKPQVQMDGSVNRISTRGSIATCQCPRRLFLTRIPPMPQTPQQRLLEQEILAGAERQARSLGMKRRQFMRTSCGMALAFAAMNSVFGRFFRVEAAELFEPAAVAENKARFFHLRCADTPRCHAQSGPARAIRNSSRQSLGMRDMARRMNPALKEQEARIEDAYLENYIKEIFLDSDTDMVALSALPGTSEEKRMSSPGSDLQKPHVDQ